MSRPEPVPQEPEDEQGDREEGQSVPHAVRHDRAQGLVEGDEPLPFAVAAGMLDRIPAADDLAHAGEDDTARTLGTARVEGHLDFDVLGLDDPAGVGGDGQRHMVAGSRSRGGDGHRAMLGLYQGHWACPCSHHAEQQHDGS